MKLLVTAGNTQILIDRVRCITNIFTGRTGTGIALHAHAAGHAVTLLTSRPEVVEALRPAIQTLDQRWQLVEYRTFADLKELLQEYVATDPPEAIIHSAAVSDYEAAGIFSPTQGTTFDAETNQWRAKPGAAPFLTNMSAGKVKSNEPELWLRLTRTPKLVDLFRSSWGFKGILVKFKLEVGLDDAALLTVAESSRRQSQADLMVANTLDGATSWAFLGPLRNGYERVSRSDLPSRLLAAVEALFADKSHG
jgi:phosphopantothenoylcysteine synthetase/decarboxylase